MSERDVANNAYRKGKRAYWEGIDRSKNPMRARSSRAAWWRAWDDEAALKKARAEVTRVPPATLLCWHCVEKGRCPYPERYFDCDVCKRMMPYCMGHSDDMPDSCSDCWAEAHKEKATG